jgi:Uma2 family endonuclease
MQDQGTVVSPPRTIMEVFRMLPEGTHAEIIEGNLYMAPSPSPHHQETTGDLFFEIKAFLKKAMTGKIYIAPVDVYLDEQANAVQPDLVFFLNNNPVGVERDGLHGVPDLLVEVLSPGNKNHDEVVKKNLYEKFGVKEYWIIDPATKLAKGYSLKEGKYAPLGEYEGQVKSVLLQHTFRF